MTVPSRRACILLVGAALLLALMTGCSIPSRPLWWPQPKHGPPVGNAVTGPDGSFRVDLPVPPSVELATYEIWLSSPDDATYNGALSSE